ncbi:hypothetical protein ACP4OV_018643 [Aristida adscensionis]
MASIWALLLFLAKLHTLLATSSAHHADGGNLTHLATPFLCHPDQAKVLLQLKKSFFFSGSTTTLPSWQNGTDCCLWEGVGCDNSSGHVTVLDLNGRGLSSYGLDPAVFNLTSLRRLDLSRNYFGGFGYMIPSNGFESKLVNLVSLDLSYSVEQLDIRHPYSLDNANYLHISNFHAVIANLNYLRQLYLDGVDLSSSGEDWCMSLATSVPRLEILSLDNCNLRGPIHKSLSRLRSLVVINLNNNYELTAGPFPELFMDFPNLSVLQLSGINLEGWFPAKAFKSVNLRVLDLSSNPNLSGHFPNFSNASSLETLRLEVTNLSFAKQTSSSNFKSLKELSLDGKLFVEFLSLFRRLGSLCHLDLELSSVSELEPIFSWIGYHKNLRSLALHGCNFSMASPSLLSNFMTLRSLTMGACFLPRSILPGIGNLVNLETLEMSECTTYGSMPSSIGNLTNLRYMYIDSCGFSGPLPAAIGNLMNLRSLYIYGGDFSGPLPAAIGNLMNLRDLSIFMAIGISGPLPAAIGNLSYLRTLQISPVFQFSGRIPHAIGQLNKLTWLDLGHCGFSGRIPGSIGNLTQLTDLYLEDNYLNGEIPSSILAFPKLRNMNLKRNQLSGILPEFSRYPSQLKFMDLSYNELSGPIPKAFFKLTGLTNLDLRSNNLIGMVELTSFWRLRNLDTLFLSNNKLCVTDRESNSSLSTYLAEPTMLGLASCNITGFPRYLAQIKHVSYLDLSCNKISGDVPNWIWENWSNSLSYLNLSHNMLTSMQLTSYVLPLTTTLQALDLSSNRLRGRIPMPKSSAKILEYSNNSLSSLLPNFTSYLSEIEYLSFSRNNINGHIPPSICNSTPSVLDLSHNSFSGSIPSCVFENGQSRLQVLNLRENHFEGMLPSNMTTECLLEMIDLHGNKIEGQLPKGLSNCPNLKLLDFGSNQIVDTFPYWLSGLSKLCVIVLRSNRFYGTIGDIVGAAKSEDCFPSLQIIDLASNNFSGKLRPEWFKWLKSMMAKFSGTENTLGPGNMKSDSQLYQYSTEITYKGSDMKFEKILTTLTAIDLSNNRLEGTIPKSIGRLVSLRVLNLSHNAFTGRIPAQLGGMIALESLDLSCNQLSGEIPPELTDLTFLDSLNLSNNHLEGKIPQARQFSTFDSSSFEGNAGLCGPQLPESPCGDDTHHTPSVEDVGKSSHHVDVVLFLFVGVGFGIGFAASILVNWGRMSRWFVAITRSASFANLTIGGRRNREGKIYVWEVQSSPPVLIARLTNQQCKSPIRQTAVSFDGTQSLELARMAPFGDGTKSQKLKQPS